MKIHTYGNEHAPTIIMLPGSLCNADTMANIIAGLDKEFHILAVDYNGQYAGSEKAFTSRNGEAKEIIQYLLDHSITSVALAYGQSMGCEIGVELLSQLRKNSIAVGAAFFDGGPFLRFPKAVSKLLGNKFKTIIGNLRGKTLEEAMCEPTIMKFSGGKPERYSSLLGPICRNAIYMSDETLEKEADACVTFDYPDIDREFQRNMIFFYSREESAWRFCHRKLKKVYPQAQYKLVSGYGHVGYPGEHLEEYCGWLSTLARGEKIKGFLSESDALDDKQKSKSYFNSHSSTIINRNGYWSYDYRITSKILMRWNVKNLIDIGCGNGAFLSIFHKAAPGVKLSGLDLSSEMVAQSRRRLPDADIVEGDAENMPFDAETFDAVSCHMSIHHHPHPNRSISEMYRILKKGGCVVINELTGPAPLRRFMNWCFTKWPTGDHAVYSRTEMEKMLREAGFEHIHSRLITPFTYVCTGLKSRSK